MKIRVTMDRIVDVRGIGGPTPGARDVDRERIAVADIEKAFDIVFDYLMDQDVEEIIRHFSYAETQQPGVNLVLYPDDEPVPLLPAHEKTTVTKPDGDSRTFGAGWSTYHRE